MDLNNKQRIENLRKQFGGGNINDNEKQKETNKSEKQIQHEKAKKRLSSKVETKTEKTNVKSTNNVLTKYFNGKAIDTLLNETSLNKEKVKYDESEVLYLLPKVSKLSPELLDKTIIRTSISLNKQAHKNLVAFAQQKAQGNFRNAFRMMFNPSIDLLGIDKSPLNHDRLLNQKTFKKEEVLITKGMYLRLRQLKKVLQSTTISSAINLFLSDDFERYFDNVAIKLFE